MAPRARSLWMILDTTARLQLFSELVQAYPTTLKWAR